MSEANATVAPEVPARMEVEAAPRGLQNRWGIATDMVVRSTESLPEFERDMIRWLGRFGAHGNYTRPEVAAMLRKTDGSPYSGDSLYQALTGRRTEAGANLQPLAQAIAALRRRQEETEAGKSTSFVETGLSRNVFRICDRARAKRRIGAVFGPSQVGKSVILAEYLRLHNHGQTQLVRMPTRGCLTHFITELAVVLKIPGQRREAELRRRIFDAFDPAILLIVDEAHQCVLGRGDTGGLTLEFIREIHDRRKCGVIICGTEVLRSALRTNPVLGQIWQRTQQSLVIHIGRNAHPDHELAEFDRAFGLEPPPDRDIGARYTEYDADGSPRERVYRENPYQLRRRVVSQESLGAYCKHLEDARDLAEASDSKMTWAKVIIAYALAAEAKGEVAA